MSTYARLAAVCCALASVVAGLATAQSQQADPAGTWGAYYGDADYPTYTVVIQPIRGGWQTSWAHFTGDVGWTGTMQRCGPAVFAEWWRPVNLGDAPWIAGSRYVWRWGEGGGVVDGMEWNLRK